MSDKEELAALRRLAELEAKASGTTYQPYGTTSIPPQELTTGEQFVSALPPWAQKLITGLPQVKGSAAHGYMMGAADPVVGATQLGANAVGLIFPSVSEAVNKGISAKEAEYEQARKERGREGIDVARLTGSALGPTTLAGAKYLPPMGTSTLGRGFYGAGLGGLSGLSQPVDVDKSSAGYWMTKAGQGLTGMAAGGISTPIIGKLGDAVISQISKAQASRSASTVDEIMAKAMQDLGEAAKSIPKQTIDEMRTRVASALVSGKFPSDPAVGQRIQDFSDLGISPLQGQVTRDPAQYAFERNARTLDQVGAPILQRLSQQNSKLNEVIRQFGDTADEAYPAGKSLTEYLKSFDEKKRQAVTALYKAARESFGKDMEVPLQGFAQDYANVLRDFGDKVPSGVRNNLNAFGLDPANPGKQTKLFTIEEADRVLKVINENVGSDGATNTALSKLRDGLKKAVLEVDASGGPFAPAVKAAADRFSMFERIPALKSAVENASPDDFVQKFVINGKVDDVRNLSKILDSDQAAQAKAQLGNYIARAAFGEAGTTFRPETFLKTLRTLGKDKLSVFFTPEEIATLQTAGRVGTYIEKFPNAAPVNTSNTAGILVNMLGKIPGVSPIIGAVQAAKNVASTTAQARQAFNAIPPTVVPQQVEGKQKLLARMLLGGGVGLGAVAGER